MTGSAPARLDVSLGRAAAILAVAVAVAPAARMVLPLPSITPLTQSRLIVTVTSPLPVTPTRLLLLSSLRVAIETSTLISKPPLSRASTRPRPVSVSCFREATAPRVSPTAIRTRLPAS